MTSMSTTKRKGLTTLQLMKRKWRLYVLLLIPLVWLIIFKYIPMYGIQIAFRDYKVRLGFWRSEWVGLKWFIRFFTSPYFGRTIRNTLTISIYGLLVSYPLTIFMALIMNSCPFPRFKSFVENVTYMPNFISVVVMVGMIMQFLNVRSGVIANLYEMLTGRNMPDLMAKPEAFKHIYVWSGIWQGLGWGTIIYIAALAGVDATLHEAAIVDGATRFQRMLHIDIPGIMPTMVIQLILACGGIVDVGFDKTYLLQNSLNMSGSDVIATYSYRVAFHSSNSDFSYSSAIGLFNAVVSAAMVVIVNSIARKISDTSLW